MQRLLAAACLLACFTTLPAADVLVIDAAGGPGADFTDLSGLAAAQDGDVVLVRSGCYAGPSPVLDGKGFTVLAEAGATVKISSGLDVRNVGPGQAFTVRGIDFDTLNVMVSSCSGPVLFEDCSFLTEGLQISVNAMEVFFSQAVTLSRCTFDWAPLPMFESETVSVFGSSLYFYDSTVNGLDLFAGGLPAIRLNDSFAFLSGTLAQGGEGAPGILGGPSGCTNGGVGGAGIVLEGDSRVDVFDSQVVGGAGGPARLPTCSDGPDGLPFVILGTSSVQQLAGTSVGLDASSPVRGGASGTRTFRATPGDQVWILYANTPMTPFSLAVFDAYLQLDLLTLCGEAAGVVPGSGTLVQTLTLPTFPGLEAAVFHTQPLVLTAAPRFVLGSPSVVVILDPGL